MTGRAGPPHWFKPAECPKTGATPAGKIGPLRAVALAGGVVP
jgi:hypothetical protein